MSEPLVTKAQLSEIAVAVDAENNATPDALAVGMMVVAMFRLQHIYERAITWPGGLPHTREDTSHERTVE